MGLALEEPKENDTVQTVNGITVAIENNILDYTKEVSLDVKSGNLVMVGTEGSC